MDKKIKKIKILLIIVLILLLGLAVIKILQNTVFNNNTIGNTHITPNEGSVNGGTEVTFYGDWSTGK